MIKREIFNDQQTNLAKQAVMLNAQQDLAAAQIKAEVRSTASLIYAMAIAPYLQGLIMAPEMADCGGKPDPEILKSFAILSQKCAPYLAQAQGRVNVDEAKHWADLIVRKQPESPILQSAG